ncbi:hypothetical protein ABIC76_000032 [Ralstonia sp. 1138]
MPWRTARAASARPSVIRRCFAGFEMEAVDINYTVGGGQGVARREVIIYSWDRAAEPVGLF